MAPAILLGVCIGLGALSAIGGVAYGIRLGRKKGRPQ